MTKTEAEIITGLVARVIDLPESADSLNPRFTRMGDRFRFQLGFWIKDNIVICYKDSNGQIVRKTEQVEYFYVLAYGPSFYHAVEMFRSKWGSEKQPRIFVPITIRIPSQPETEMVFSTL